MNTKDFLLRKLLQKADEEGYAIGAFNFHSMTELQAIVDAAEEENSPVIVMAKLETIEAMNSKGVQYIESIAQAAKERLHIPIILHLDHGAVYHKDNYGEKHLDCKATYNKIEECIKSGFDSVMVDGSTLPLDENITWTKKVVERAHKKKVCVEGEVGIIPATVENVAKLDFSDPEEVRKFAENTNVDAVAPAVGTEHGIYKKKPRINFSLLQEINELIKTPLVLHGGTGISDSDWRESIRLGINKGNIGTSIKIIFTSALRSELKNNIVEIDPRKYLPPARDAVKKLVKEKIRLLGSAGKA